VNPESENDSPGVFHTPDYCGSGIGDSVNAGDSDLYTMFSTRQ